MGKYIFLTGFYLPAPGATGMCVHQLAKEIANHGHEVTTICYADDDNKEEFDGVKIVKILIPSFLKQNLSTSPLERRLNQLRSLMSKFVHIKKYPLRSIGLVKRYYNELEKLIENDEHVVVIASVNPLEAVIATDRIKKKYPDSIKSVYYCADTLSNEKGDNGILSAEYRTKCGLMWEKKLFESFDKIMIMECHKNHYFSEEFAVFRDKMELVNFPLFTKLDIEEKELESNVTQFVYTGTLNRKLRNPQYLCSLLGDLVSKIQLHVDFLGSGDCDDILDEVAVKTEGAIERLGMQPHYVAIKYIEDADVLLSIGNANSPMAPSKIYEYMSTGKPIIHVYSYDKDPCLEPLKKYGNALLIKDGDLNGSSKLYNFVTNRKTLNYEEVYDKFITSTPDYSVEIIEKL